MKQILKKISSPLLSLALLMLSNGFFLTYVSARLHVDNYTPFEIGIIQGCYYAGFLIAALKSEQTIQRIKHIRAFSFFACIATACTLATVFANHLIIWALMRFIMGICIAALYVVIESWFLIVGDKNNRGVILAIYMTGLYLSQASSQYIINLIEINSMVPFIVAGILASLSILPVAFTFTTIPDMEPTQTKDIFKFFTIAPFGTIGAALSGVMLGSFYAFGPTFAQKFNLSIAHLMSVTIAGGFLLQYPIGHLSDIFDRRRVLIFVSIMTLILPLILVLMIHSKISILICSFFIGGFSFTIYPLSITQVIDRASPREATTVAGVMLFAYSIGAVIGPLTTPIFIEALHSQIGLYYAISFASLLLLLMGIVAIILKRPVLKENQESFVAIPPQTPIIGDLDPRLQIPKKDPSQTN